MASRDSYYLAAIDRVACAAADLERVPALLAALGLGDAAGALQTMSITLATVQRSLLALRATEPHPDEQVPVRSHGERRG